MKTIAGEVQWATQENDDGSLGVVGMVGFKVGIVIPVTHVGNDEKEEMAKRKVIAKLFEEIYGDLDTQLRDLEASISRTMPPFYFDDEPLMRCRHIQRDIWRKLNGPHAKELLGTRN